MQNAEDSYQQARHYADDAEKSRDQMEAMMAAMERINQTSNKIGNMEPAATCSEASPIASNVVVICIFIFHIASSRREKSPVYLSGI
mgnify:CR=1 FL=1